VKSQNRPGRPPSSGQFTKGVSGNPKGRPRSLARSSPSAFDVVLDRTLSVKQGATSREITLEEALQRKTYEAAIAGNRSAIRAVLKMIAKREKWLEAHAPNVPRLTVVYEKFIPPADVNAALKVLDMTEVDQLWKQLDPTRDRPRLKPWAIQAALSRPGRRSISQHDIEWIERLALEPESICWPRGIKR
jgi:hypothetical protein